MRVQQLSRRPVVRLLTGAALLGVVLVAACSPSQSIESASGTSAIGPDVTEFVDRVLAGKQVPPWTRSGKPIARGEINTIAMPEHCEWQSIVALHLGWPLGTDSTHVSQIRQFLRDPQDALHRGLDDELDERASLPADAKATGYQVGQVSVLLAVSDQSAIYLSDGDRTERRPEVNPVVACD